MNAFFHNLIPYTVRDAGENEINIYINTDIQVKSIISNHILRISTFYLWKIGNFIHYLLTLFVINLFNKTIQNQISYDELIVDKANSAHSPTVSLPLTVHTNVIY